MSPQRDGDVVAGVKRCPRGHPFEIADMQAFGEVASDADLYIVLAGGADCDDCRRVALLGAGDSP